MTDSSLIRAIYLRLIVSEISKILTFKIFKKKAIFVKKFQCKKLKRKRLGGDNVNIIMISNVKQNAFQNVLKLKFLKN